MNIKLPLNEGEYEGVVSLWRGFNFQDDRFDKDDTFVEDVAVTFELTDPDDIVSEYFHIATNHVSNEEDLMGMLYEFYHKVYALAEKETLLEDVMAKIDYINETQE